MESSGEELITSSNEVADGRTLRTSWSEATATVKKSAAVKAAGKSGQS
jgi:hypothetical protein